MANNQVGVQNFKTGKRLTDISCLEHFRTRNSNGYFFILDFFNDLFEPHLFKVQNHIRHVLDYTGNRRKLMFYPVDTNRRNRKAFERGEENTAQSVTYGNTVTGLQRTEFEFTEKIVRFQH